MIPILPSQIIFADETQYNVGRYRGVAAVSFAFEHADAFSTELCQLLHDSGMREFKWAALRTARQRFAASKLLTWTFHTMQREFMRVDVLPLVTARPTACPAASHQLLWY